MRQRIGSVCRQGQAPTAAVPVAVTDYAYDNLHRLISRSYPSSADNITYAYDLLGRTTATNKTGYAISYVYDNAGRLTSTTAGGKTLAYQYDPAGNRTRLIPILFRNSNNIAFTFGRGHHGTEGKWDGAT